MATLSSASAAPPPPSRNWLLERLDSLLSEPLRKGVPTDLVRYRLLVGAACFLVLFNAIYTAGAMWSGLSPYPSAAAALLYVGVLIVARRSATPQPPAAMLLTSMMFAILGACAEGRVPLISTHTICALLPVFAVYLAGARVGLFITLFMVVALALVFPLYFTLAELTLPPISPSLFWLMHLFSGISMLGTWGVGALHNAATDAAQSSREQTLRALRQSENKLSSLLESTDDLVLAIDREGRLIAANAAALQFHLLRFGRAPQVGEQLPEESPERTRRWAPHVARVFEGMRVRFEDEFDLQGTRLSMDIRLSPLLDANGQTVGMTLFSRDITARREAEARLGEMHRALLDVSRQAGMAEVATGVLHNVGNTLNSVNVSAGLVMDRLRLSRVSNLARAVQLLREHTGDFPSFLTHDPRGQQLPDYLMALSEQLQYERDALLQEMHSLSEGVDHIKSIVSMQQRHASSAGVQEEVELPLLIDEALRLHAGAYEARGIRIERDYAPVPSLSVDRHKLLQILVNLLSNARDALMESPRQDKRLLIGIRPAPEGKRVLIQVTDNGVGIAPESLPRLFTQGFTTKKTGHGFGLHISALAAMELRGRLTCDSPGLGQGATFTLDLPVNEEAGDR
ncbi:two-component system sensor histidine kinase NtrB [Hyalangium gracile]|uniref:two-component system sensor histidine kinase NtrB n=1 Tax=Hyalangium gracile TaxID=394092 RepID=UPI001CCD248D|nr:ATP-binding protein [Hyalangium gracile]